MKYISSRGGEAGLSFEQVLFSGYAKDGGLYFPETIPKIDLETLKSWKNLSYPEIVQNVMQLYIGEDEIPGEDLSRLLAAAFSKFKSSEQPIPISRLNGGLNIAELYHGPTLAFKDLALGVVGQLYDYFLGRAARHVTVLIGTSGDTGSAAISAVRGLHWVDVVVLLPHGRCTTIQELQMTTVLEDNVHCFAVDGNSDELDVPIKAVFADPEYVKDNSLCSINSINWARILVQISHFIYCYLQLADVVGEAVTVVCPTGACGNIASGYLAHQMGVPLELVAAVTENDVVHRTFSTGDYSLNMEVLQTWATAMDIQVPYNVERILLMAAGLDTARVAAVMEEFEREARSVIPNDLLEVMKTVVVDSKTVVNNEMIETMVRCHEENNNYIICPHTAVGVSYHYSNKTSRPQVVLATASPDKFPEAVEAAGIEAAMSPDIAALFSLPTRSVAMERGAAWETMLREKIGEITKKHRQT